jgi:hypothetical protein
MPKGGFAGIARSCRMRSDNGNGSAAIVCFSSAVSAAFSASSSSGVAGHRHENYG